MFGFNWLRKRRLRIAEAEAYFLKEERERREEQTRLMDEADKALCEKQEKEYFDLPVYPSGRDCWACGDDSNFEKRPVKQMASGSYFRKEYGRRRYLEVSCPRCGSILHERFVKPVVRPQEIEPEKVNLPTADTDIKGEEEKDE